MAKKIAPLNASFMLTAMLGFLISVIYVRKIDISWATAFAIVFLIMIIAAFISMLKAPVAGQLMPKFEKKTMEPDYVLENIRKKSYKNRAQARLSKKGKR
jgi:hypothetical protein